MSVSTSPSAFFTPATSVSSSKRSAFKAPAMAPAAVSALTLKVSPPSPAPTGATTGMNAESMNCVRTAGLIPFRLAHKADIERLLNLPTPDRASCASASRR